MVAERDPHTAYVAFTHGLVSRLQYVKRTTPDISHVILLEEIICHKLIPLLIETTSHNGTPSY